MQVSTQGPLTLNQLYTFTLHTSYKKPHLEPVGVSTLDLVPIQITLIRIKLVRIGYTLRPHMNHITLVCMLSH